MFRQFPLLLSSVTGSCYTERHTITDTSVLMQFCYEIADVHQYQKIKNENIKIMNFLNAWHFAFWEWKCSMPQVAQECYWVRALTLSLTLSHSELCCYCYC